MSAAVADSAQDDIYVIPAAELRGAILQIAECGDAIVGVDGPAGTGKTFGILYYIHCMLLQYPGAKYLVARKHNTDLSASAMATFRELVLDPHEGVEYFGGNHILPPHFRYPNGSKLFMTGLDKPGKVKSQEYDGVYVNEATECTVDDIEFCWMRLGRRGVLPVQQMLLDFNPDAPTHFLNQRMNAGDIVRLRSYHEDNPYLYNAQRQEWTDAGVKYIARLDQLTGVRLARFRFGLWQAAEGTVYEKDWDTRRNLLPRAAISAKPENVYGDCGIPRTWKRWMVLDFGYTHPFVCKWYAEDPDGRLIMYREIYGTERLVEDHCKDILSIMGYKLEQGRLAPSSARTDPLPYGVIADHDAEDRKTFSRHTGLQTIAAYKDVKVGIQLVAGRLHNAGDGHPRLVYLKDSLVKADPKLLEAKKPTCSEQEWECYVWKKLPDGTYAEEPAKDNDHGLDCDRYMIAHLDAKRSSVITRKKVF